MSGYRVAVLGATGVVGKEMLHLLEERNFPVKELVPLASSRSAGQTIYFKGEHIEVKEATDASFEGIDFGLFSAGGSISAQFAPAAAKADAVVVDNTSHFRMDPSVPLVVPEVNKDAIKTHQGIIANPNCSTAQMVVVLNPIHQKVGIKRLVISTYQSVSGAGKDAIEALESESRASLAGQSPEGGGVFPHPIAFNVLPHIDQFTDNGYTKEELKMVNETQKILGDSSIAITATTVRVPVFISHSEAVNVETKEKLSAVDCRAMLAKTDGVEVVDEPAQNRYPTARDASGKNPVYVGRIREDISNDKGLDMWIVADNLRKGAALNAIQILEAIIES